MDHFDLIAAQRRRLADTLSSLSEEQFAMRSLCDAWTIHDVVAHLVMPHETSIPRVVLAMARARGNFDVANQIMTARIARATSADLVMRLRAHADGHFTPPGHDSLAPLTDVYVHSMDIAVPLGITPPVDESVWPLVLTFLTSAKGRKGFVGRPLPDVSLVTTDRDVRLGNGPEVTGAGGALALALLGRPAFLDTLSGPGADTLRKWARTNS